MRRRRVQTELHRQPLDLRERPIINNAPVRVDNQDPRIALHAPKTADQTAAVTDRHEFATSEDHVRPAAPIAKAVVRPNLDATNGNTIRASTPRNETAKQLRHRAMSCLI